MIHIGFAEADFIATYYVEMGSAFLLTQFNSKDESRKDDSYELCNSKTMRGDGA